MPRLGPLLLSIGLALPLAACRWPWQPEGDGAITLSGSVEAHELDLGFQVGGRIARLQVDEGNAVQAGQAVAELDASDLQLAAERARAQAEAARQALAALQAGARPEELRAAEAALAQARADRQLADQQVLRTQQLIAQGFISPDQMDRVRSAATTAAARVDQVGANLALLRAGARPQELQRARAELDAAVAARAAAERQLGYVTLTSPISGIVSVRLVERGQVVPAGQPVLRIAELSRPWVRAYLAEGDLARVRLGQPVEVRVDGLPRQRFSGRLAFIAPQAEFTPKTVETRALRVDLVYRVKVDVDDPQGALKIGMPADLRLAPTAAAP
ncbi:efflux RND transporter periplasmic adaptor subunit [Aquabacterium sp.]|uniref:efflux RND transporter periplasmic adaptor subunit n=1 Tax=Aquabacterium sp. TaxID=1872578 RepID=UPI003784EDEC